MNQQSVRRYFREKMARRRGKTSVRTEFENLQVITAWQQGELSDSVAADFVGCNPGELAELLRQAAEAGKRLAR